MTIQKDLNELTSAGVITHDSADKIGEYYRSRSAGVGTRSFIVFGVLGSILVGLGVILIVAHNWNEFSKAVKLIFAFLPLIIAQTACGVVYLKKGESISLREASATFLFFAVGAGISLVSQIYNIQGNLSEFIFTWILLCLPLTYLMRSSMVSLLFIIGATSCYCINNPFFWSRTKSIIDYWWMITLVVPHYVLLVRTKPGSNFTAFHTWILPLSLTLCLGTVADKQDDMLYIAYMSLFGSFYLLGTSEIFSRMKPLVNGYRTIGSLGTMLLLLILSFHSLWENISWNVGKWTEWYWNNEVSAAVIFSLTGMIFLVFRYRKGLKKFPLTMLTFLLFIPIFIIGTAYSLIAVVMINILLLALGLVTLRKGLRTDHLGLLNYGLLIITALIICRFFDTQLSFVLRGILFVLVGAGFFLSNYIMLKKRKHIPHT